MIITRERWRAAKSGEEQRDNERSRDWESQACRKQAIWRNVANRGYWQDSCAAIYKINQASGCINEALIRWLVRWLRRSLTHRISPVMSSRRRIKTPRRKKVHLYARAYLTFYYRYYMLVQHELNRQRSSTIVNDLQRARCSINDRLSPFPPSPSPLPLPPAPCPLSLSTNEKIVRR